MALVVDITSGSRAGARENFTRPIIVAGRHPHSDLRFDAQKDLDVSTRHAEFRSTRGGWTVQDLGSTNGTFVNGRPISQPTPVKTGDQVKFGEKGPTIQIVSAGPVGEAVAPPRTEMRSSQGGIPRPKTEERIAIAVARHTSRLTQFVIALGITVVIGVGALVWLNQQQASQSNEAIQRLIARGDSLANALQQSLADASTRAAGFDSVERILREERARLRQQLQAGANAEQITSQLDALHRRGNQALQLTNREISDANTKAVAYLVIEEQGEPGKPKPVFSGTGFGISSGGLLVTNKHLVVDSLGRTPSRIGAYFSDTDVLLPAHVVKVSESHDLAFLQIDDQGTYPVVRGVASSANVGMGDAAVIIGYPLGTDLPQGGKAKKATLVVGTVGKVVTDTLQLNAYSAPGASGSPVFDSRGFVIGVLFGGKGAAGGNIVFLVPSDALIAQLPAEARGIVR